MERITCPCGKRESLEKAVNIAGYLRCAGCQQEIENTKKRKKHSHKRVKNMHDGKNK
jgi:hypothetical protein